MEDWKIIFLSQNGWFDVICRFQPLIFQGVASVRDPTTRPCWWPTTSSAAAVRCPAFWMPSSCRAMPRRLPKAYPKPRWVAMLPAVGPGLGHRLVGKWGVEIIPLIGGDKKPTLDKSLTYRISIYKLNLSGVYNSIYNDRLGVHLMARNPGCFSSVNATKPHQGAQNPTGVFS